jgi:hypothetical protein
MDWLMYAFHIGRGGTRRLSLSKHFFSSYFALSQDKTRESKKPRSVAFDSLVFIDTMGTSKNMLIVVLFGYNFYAFG